MMEITLAAIVSRMSTMSTKFNVTRGKLVIEIAFANKLAAMAAFDRYNTMKGLSCMIATSQEHLAGERR